LQAQTSTVCCSPLSSPLCTATTVQIPSPTPLTSMLSGFERYLMDQPRDHEFQRCIIANNSIALPCPQKELHCLCTAQRATNALYAQLLLLWNVVFLPWEKFLVGMSVLVVLQIALIMSHILLKTSMPRTVHPYWWLLGCCWVLLLLLVSVPRIACGSWPLLGPACFVVFAYEDYFLPVIAVKNLLMSFGAFVWLFTSCEHQRHASEYNQKL
jgi:hypothetical protein